MRPGPRLDPRGDAGEHRDAQRHRHEGQAGLDRREAQGLLQVQRGEEVDAEDPEGPDHHGPAAAAELPAPEHLQVHHGMGRTGLDDQEDPGGDSGQRERPEDARRGPAALAALDQGVGQREQGQRGGRQAGQVELAHGGFGPRLGHVEDRDREGDHAHRHVDEEDPAPVEVLADQAAERRAGRQGQRPGRGPDADGHAPLPDVGERGHDDGQRGRHEQGRPDALDGPAGDEHSPAAGQPGGQRGQREDRHADQEQPAPPEHVGEPAADQQQPGHREQVAAHHPLQAGHRQVQAVLDGRDRHVDDVVVQVGHEGGQAHGCQGPPAPGVQALALG